MTLPEQTTLTPDQSWLHGKYHELNAEINTKLPYVAINDYFWQGEEADRVISEIHKIWTSYNDFSIQDAIQKYIHFYL